MKILKKNSKYFNFPPKKKPIFITNIKKDGFQKKYFGMY